VRELRQVITRAVQNTGTHAARFVDLVFEPEQLPPTQVSLPSFAEQRKMVVDRFERAFLTELLRTYDGNLHQCARASGLDRAYLRRLLRRHDLHEPSVLNVDQ
jgi:transcriptional regulator with GAF, ATPase, and Fis domain